MAIMGGLIAGSVTAIIGLQACYVIDCVSFFVSAAVLYYGIQGNYNVRTSPTDDNPDQIREYIDHGPLVRACNVVKQVFSYLTTCGFGALVFMKASGGFIWSPEDVIGSLFATVRSDTGQEEEGKSSIRTGVLFSIIGLGNMFGPTIINYVTDAGRPYTLQRASITGLSVITFGWYLISLAPSFTWFLAFSLIRTLGSGMLYANSTLTLQAMTDKEILGRVLSVEYTFYTLLEAAGATMTGRLDDAGLNNNMLALFAAGLGTAVSAFWVTYHLFSKGAASPKFNRPEIPYDTPAVSKSSASVLELSPMEVAEYENEGVAVRRISDLKM